MATCACCGPQARVDSGGFEPRRFGRTPASAPGPSGPQMLRHYPMVARRPLAYLADATERHGPVVQFPIPAPATYLISGSHAARSVLQAQAHLFDKDTIQYRALGLVTGEGLLAATEEPWRAQRPIVQPAFHHRVLSAFGDDVSAATQRLLQRWRLVESGAVVDVDRAMLQIGLEVVGQHLFAADLRTTAVDLAEATLVALESVVAAASPPWGLLPAAVNPRRRRFDAALTHLNAAVAELVAARGREDEAGADLLSLLVAAYDDSPSGRRQVRDQVVTFMVAGHETVASSLTWTLGLLADSPTAQGEVAAEVDRVLGREPPTWTDLADLPVTRAVVDEGLRLYPPAWIVTRTAVADTVIAGRRIPAGALVIVSPWVEHRDPRRWPQPNAFAPHRFLSRDGRTPGSVARAATAHADYLPFGTGPRLCIGRDMAVLESVLVLATLAQHWWFTAADGRLPEPDPMVTLRPRGGLRVRLTPRS